MKILLMLVLLIAVAAGGYFAGREDLLPLTTEPSDAAAPKQREPLYWVAPMDASYRRDGPGKSPMGMDLVPVYEDTAAADEPALRIAPEVINNIGVKTVAVRRADLARTVRAVGTVVPDADRVTHVHIRSEGWIEQLQADFEGRAVQAGERLFRFYSPELVNAKQEYLQALKLGQARLIEASAERLRALGLTDAQVKQLAKDRDVQRLTDVRARTGGFVHELNVREGMYVAPGNTIMSLVDLAEVWVEVDVHERDLPLMREGLTARMQLAAPGSAMLEGTVDYVYPTVRAASRTGRLRLRFPNPKLTLKPNMYVDVTILAAPRSAALVVPSEAVIRVADGARVMLSLGDGRFRPAQVRPGIEADGQTEILAGLSEGERVVRAGQFLLDSEASLSTGLMRFLPPASVPDEGAAPGQPLNHGHDAMAPGEAAMEADGAAHDHSGHGAAQEDAPDSDAPADGQDHSMHGGSMKAAPARDAAPTPHDAHAHGTPRNPVPRGRVSAPEQAMRPPFDAPVAGLTVMATHDAALAEPNA